MAFRVPHEGRESKIGDQRSLVSRNHRLGANSHNTELENTYSPPTLSIQRKVAAQPSQQYRNNPPPRSEYYFPRNNMAEDLRTMSAEEIADLDLEIKKARVEEVGYIFGGIPLDASHGIRIAMRQENGRKDPIARFRSRRQSSSASSNASSSFSQYTESGPVYEPTTNCVAVVHVRKPSSMSENMLNYEVGRDCNERSQSMPTICEHVFDSSG